MPIRRELFDQGLDETDLKICDFLKTNSDQAYTLREVAQGVGVNLDALEPLERVVSRLEVSTRLLRLSVKGYIEARSLGGETYYAWRKPK